MKKNPFLLIFALTLILGLTRCDNLVQEYGVDSRVEGAYGEHKPILPLVIIEPVSEQWLVLKSIEQPKKLCEDGLLFLGSKPEPKNQEETWWWYKINTNCQIEFIGPYQLIDDQYIANTRATYLVVDTIKNLPPEMESLSRFWNSLSMRIRWLPMAYLNPGKNIYYTYRINTIKYDPKTLWVDNIQQARPAKFIYYEDHSINLGITKQPPVERSSPILLIFLILAFAMPLFLKPKVEYFALGTWVIWTALLFGYHLLGVDDEDGPIGLMFASIFMAGLLLLIYIGTYRTLKSLSKKIDNSPSRKHLNRVLAFVIINTIIFVTITCNLTFCWVPAVLSGLSFIGARLTDRWWNELIEIIEINK